MGKIPSGSQRELAPEGNSQPGVCIGFTDLGTQAASNPEWPDQRKCQIAWQLVDEQTKDGKAMVVYKKYTYTDSEKGNLAKDLKSWLALKSIKGFDPDELLGKAGLLSIIHEETDRGTFAKITSVAGVPKGMKIRKHTEPLRSLYLDENFDQEAFDELPEFLRNLIAPTPEYAAIMEPRMKKGAKKETGKQAPVNKQQSKNKR